MRKKLQIFISSTFLDLKEERQVCVQAILKAGHIPAGMELFTAGDKSQLEVIKRWIDDSDICVLILGSRYGTLEPESKISYTEFEYRYAIDQGKTVFALVQSESAKDIKVKLMGASAVETANVEKFVKFRDFVHSKMCEFFDDNKDLKYLVSQTISHLEKEKQFAGWVSGADVKSIESVSTKKDVLAEENLNLKQEIEALRGQLKKTAQSKNSESYNGVSFEEVVNALSKKEVEIPAGVSKKYGGTKLPLVYLVDICSQDLTVGVSNAVGNSEKEIWCFYQIARELIVYGIVEHAPVPLSVKWEKLRTSNLGNQFLAKLKVIRAKDGTLRDISAKSRSKSKGNS